MVSKAAKKGIKFSANIYKRTRNGTDILPSDPNMSKFNLKNISLAPDLNQLKYLCQEFMKLTLAQCDKLGFDSNKKAELVASLLKQSQKEGIFALADTAVFVQEPNLVSNILWSFMMCSSNISDHHHLCQRT